MYEQQKNSTNDSMSKKLRTVSWCTGYAGIELGISRIGIGIKPVAFCEIESFAIKNLISKMEQGHLHPTPVWTNCKIFPSGRFCGQVDLFIAGFPCQPFSTAGKRNASDDPRHLFPYVVEGIKGMQPNILFFENVEGILSAKMPGGESVALYVLREMESCGYKVTWGIYSASEVGAPHQRKRVFFMGMKGESEKYKNLDNKGFEKELKAERLSWNKRKKNS
jgi:DNA (cytosine-5)-methyltransferase 1